MIKVSIIIPIYNVEDYISECIKSAINQTLQDIEIICIDDASTDNSLAIVEKYARQDSRIKILSYKTNKSASQARKDGALLAKGKYIMFVDGDDFLELNACEILYSTITKKKVDIVHFGTNVINAGNVPQTRLSNLNKLLKPYYGTLKNKDVFKGCFVDNKYRFSIWNKIYEANFCKNAISHVKDGNFPKAQDLYAFFIICYYATSYYGIKDNLYNYRFGTGITGNKTLTLSQLERYCHSVYVAEEIQNFLVSEKQDDYFEISEKIRKDLLNDCINNWYAAIKDTDTAKGFDLLCKYWKPTEIVGNLCEKHYNSRKLLAEKIFGATSLQCTPRTIKTIGIFYHRYALGGVQRVISLLIPMYIEMGYKVVLFTDEISEDNEYVLPHGVTRVVLPSSLTIKNSEYIERASIFENETRRHNIDIMCYQAGSSPKLLFDMLLMQLNNIPVIVSVHEVAFQNMLTLNTEMVNRPSIYKLVNKLVVLSQIEELYWKNLGVPAVYIPNPIELDLIERDLTKVEKNTIVWIGRLDTRTKRCLDVVDIMKYVAEEIPDAKLLMVGNEFSSGVYNTMHQKIKRLDVEKNVVLCGATTDVDSYYRKAELHMISSISETFPMTIAESKAYGIPLVMYELPFIELCRNSNGYLSAPQGDKKKMADNIIRILRDESLKKQLQEEAHESLKPFLDFDLKNEWKKLFDSILKNNSPAIVIDENLNILLRSLLQHYNYGATIEKSVSQQKAKELNKIKKSYSYKLGQILLYIPHKIIWTIRKAYKRNAINK